MISPTPPQGQRLENTRSEEEALEKVYGGLRAVYEPRAEIAAATYGAKKGFAAGVSWERSRQSGDAEKAYAELKELADSPTFISGRAKVERAMALLAPASKGGA